MIQFNGEKLFHSKIIIQIFHVIKRGKTCVFNVYLCAYVYHKTYVSVTRCASMYVYDDDEHILTHYII